MSKAGSDLFHFTTVEKNDICWKKVHFQFFIPYENKAMAGAEQNKAAGEAMSFRW